MRFRHAFITGAAFLVATATLATPSIANAADKYKIFLSMSYSGNGWQTEAQNMIEAMAKAHGDQLELKTQIAGTDVQRQIQQINAMVQAGANAILVYPISPTALNAAIKNACAKHVVVFAYDSKVTEPCAYNVYTDQTKLAADSAEWVAKKMNGQGNLIFVTGVSGTSVDTERNDAARDIFKKYPGIKIVAEPNGMWSTAIARKVLTETMSTRKWSDVNGIWGAAACYVGWSMQREAGLSADKLVPCGVEGLNGMRVAMLKKGTATTVNGDYLPPAGAPGVSLESHPASGALALKLALKVLGGGTVPKTTLMPLEAVTPENARLCKTGSWVEMKDGCNTFDPARVPPSWVSNIYSPDTPEIGLAAALNRLPEPK